MTWKRNIQQFVIVQFGITTFYRVPSENAYKADSFSFYLFPRSIPLKNRQLSWEVEAIDFLHKHGFDFNKVCSQNTTGLKCLYVRLGKFFNLAVSNLS